MKSWFFAGGVIERCVQIPGSRIVCLREIQKALKESVKLLIEDLIQSYGVASKFHILNDRILTAGDGLIVFQGMQDHTVESIKSLEGFDIGYFEEAQTCTKRSLEMLRPTIRKPKSELWFSWNPRNASDPVDAFFRGHNGPPSDAIVVRTNWRDNRWFTKELEDERKHDEKHNPHRYRHIWEGDYEPGAVGAIWDLSTINQQRRAREDVPEFKRIVVAIDPAGSSEEHADETGIVVCALGVDNHGYVLEDLSMHGKPNEWATRALAGYDLYEADAIVVETNYGGDMAINTVHAVRKEVRVIPVRAHRGQKKHIRAEPISALYNLGRVSHVGAFPKLEAEMCLTTAGGYEGEGSPGRMDAMVYAFTELFPKMIRREVPKGRPLPTRANSRYSVHRRFV